MTHGYEEIDIDAYKTRFYEGDNNHLLLDVRTVEEYEQARIPGAVNIPLDELMDRVEEVKAHMGDDPVVMVCRTGVRSAMGAQTLRQLGLKDATLINLDGGTLQWARQKWPLESGPTE